MPITVYKRGEVFHYRGTVNGQLFRGSCKTGRREIAERLAAEIEAKAWKRHFDGPEATLTFSQAAGLYMKAGKSRRYISPLLDYWRDTLVRDINAGAIKQAAIELYPNVKAITRNRQVIVPAQAIINHAAAMDLCRPIKVRRFDVDQFQREYADLAWVEALRKAARPHIGALALFMYLTGARISEALKVKWDDIDFGKHEVLIRQTKTRTERKAHLPDLLVEALKALPRKPRKGPFIYTSRQNALKGWTKDIAAAGIKPLSFHCCRHGFATGLLRAGVDVVTVAKLGGWKSAQEVLKTYGHASDDKTLSDRLVGSTPQTQNKTKRAQSA